MLDSLLNRRARSSKAAGRRRAGTVGLLAAAALLLSGCGLAPAASYVPEAAPGSIQPVPGAEGVPVKVTGRNNTESLILAKMAVLAAQAAGFEVSDLSNVPGSQPTRSLMLAGKADIIWEYTGTAWLSFMGHDSGIPDQKAQWQAVHDEDLANGLTWGAKAPLNNTYALSVTNETAKKYGLSKLSDIAKLPVDQRTFCVEPEFNSRPDGFGPMLKHYGLDRGSASGVPEGNIGVYDVGALYTATDSGQCTFGEVYATDGRIDALGLTVLKDDQQFFPAYNVAPVFNSRTLAAHPQLAGIFEQMSPLLTDRTMRKLNLKVDVEGQEPADVAFEWMKEQGFLSDAQR
ncbi:glycine betaine ABC transporter substrate-binding protein [Arthrobacter sp. I2-34]|uniref:Glycine betaine ABC transporter substrate-binding protein n=1 Tax=Arthrobacter hankyongi TaxID=2904801 RepID=A0ABS9LCV3_9MICC|nr:glycine betaine ABC transporter substrate-binding protein [Arthrobacter hankyongi]MCG2624314.1 glycine betaine ABC transporter substrate-binding protein [Arthrobacter hankyongi]